jgi:hypothetical protein
LAVRKLPIVVALCGLMLSAPLPAYAQNAGPGNTNSPPGDNSPVATFLANPSGLLTTYPQGGGSMVAAVTGLVQADLGTLGALTGLAATANQDQKNAIGSGIGLAALELIRTNPQAGQIIQDAIVKLNDPTILAAYAAVTGNQRLAAAGPGGGGSAGAGESATGTATANGGIGGPSVFALSFGTPNVADAFNIPSFTSSTPGTPTTSVGTSVSSSTP